MKNQSVKNIVKNSPEFLEDYLIISTRSYISKYGDEYLIFGTVSRYQNYTDVICSADSVYLSLGSEDYSDTIETVERLSLLSECDRTLKATSTYLIA